MTLTLELSPAVEAALEAEAIRRGVTPPAVAGEVLGNWAQGHEPQGHGPEGKERALTSRQQAVLAGYGKFAGRGRTVDDFLRERREESDREDAATHQRLSARRARSSGEQDSGEQAA